MKNYFEDGVFNNTSESNPHIDVGTAGVVDVNIIEVTDYQTIQPKLPIKIASINLSKIFTCNTIISEGFEYINCIDRSVSLDYCNATNKYLCASGFIEEKINYSIKSDLKQNSLVAIENINKDFFKNNDIFINRINFNIIVPINLSTKIYELGTPIKCSLNDYSFDQFITFKKSSNKITNKYDTVEEHLVLTLIVDLAQNKKLPQTHQKQTTSKEVLIGNFVWHDLNGDGIQDIDEPGIKGVVVTLFNSSDVPISSTETSSSGYYSFKTLPGSYYIQFTPPLRYKFTKPNKGDDKNKNSKVNEITGKTNIFTLREGETTLSMDAGLYLTSSISGLVWYTNTPNSSRYYKDIAQNKIGIGNITVNLWNNNMHIGNPIQTTTTKISRLNKGSYTFTDVLPGSYYIEFILPNSRYTFTQNNKYSTANKFGFTDIITISSNENIENIDAKLAIKNSSRYYNSYTDFY